MTRDDWYNASQLEIHALAAAVHRVNKQRAKDK